jgi:quercetin dioxygenase-like cupin family protein
MNFLMHQPSSLLKDEASLIFQMLPDALSNVPFHQDTEAVTRFFAQGFPLHIGAHQVSLVEQPPLEYTQPHVHEQYDEINIIVSPQELVYKVKLGSKEYIVHNNACIWIPKGVIHSANVLNGAGYYIALRLD